GNFRTCSSWKAAHAVPRSSRSFVIVLIDRPVIRVIDRRLLPSTIIPTMRPRSAVLSLFILNIMLKRGTAVKYLHRYTVFQYVYGVKSYRKWHSLLYFRSIEFIPAAYRHDREHWIKPDHYPPDRAIGRINPDFIA